MQVLLLKTHEKFNEKEADLSSFLINSNSALIKIKIMVEDFNIYAGSI